MTTVITDSTQATDRKRSETIARMWYMRDTSDRPVADDDLLVIDDSRVELLDLLVGFDVTDRRLPSASSSPVSPVHTHRYYVIISLIITCITCTHTQVLCHHQPHHHLYHLYTHTQVLCHHQPHHHLYHLYTHTSIMSSSASSSPVSPVHTHTQVLCHHQPHHHLYHLYTHTSIMSSSASSSPVSPVHTHTNIMSSSASSSPVSPVHTSSPV